MLHPEADAIVDDGGAADDATLKHDDVAVGCCLQGAILEQTRGHPCFFMGDAG